MAYIDHPRRSANHDIASLPLFAAARDREVRALPPAAARFASRYGIAPATAVLFAETFTSAVSRGR